HGFRESSDGYEFALQAPQRIEGLTLMIPAVEKEQTVEIDGRPVVVSNKEVRNKRYLIYSGDFEGMHQVRVQSR
ncbi:hypothetical protein MYX78_12670, partial [Acidobacteria bacterium AH-259-G07]|nr:hypothetical protein [Acidobacteria bacterium AH-259-G07]